MKLAPRMASRELDYPSDLYPDELLPGYAFTAAQFAARARNSEGEIYGWRAYLELAAYREMCQGEAFSDDLPPGMLAEIRRIATEHGKAAASWAFDGNTTRETYKWARKGIDDGDPLVLDSFRAPDLTGEYGDDYTERDLAEDLGIESPSLDDRDVQATQGLVDDAAMIYEDLAREAFWAEIERTINVQLAPCETVEQEQDRIDALVADAENSPYLRRS